MSDWRIHIIGNPSSPDVRPYMGAILSSAGDLPIRFLDYRDGWKEAVAAGLGRDLLVILQTRPFQFSRIDFRDLYDEFCLADWLIGTTPWCASTQRRERIWPDGVTVAFDELPYWIECWRDGLRCGEVLSTERMRLGNSWMVVPRFSYARRIGVSSSDRCMSEWLSELIHDAGGQPHDLRHDSVDIDALDGVLWDADMQTPNWLARWGQQRGNGTMLPIVALVDQPRSQWIDNVIRSHVTTVIPKLSSEVAIVRAFECFEESSSSRRRC